MHDDLFLQHVRDLSLEKGKAYLQAHLAELADHEAVGNRLAEEALRLRGANPFVSLTLAELLIFFGSIVHHPLLYAHGLKAKGDALEYIGHYEGALEAFDVAGQEFLRQGDEVNWAHTRIGWITACAWLGRTDEALKEAASAREILRQHGKDYWVCAIDHNTAVIYTQIGQYKQALDLYERMLAIYPTLTSEDETTIKRAIAMAENNRARNLAWLGDFQQAYVLLQRAQASFEELGQINEVIRAEANLADLDYALGYYGSALRRYYHIRDSFTQHSLDNPVMLASIMLLMALCLVKVNRTDEASRLAKESVEGYRQLGTSLDTGIALREYATTLVASGRLKEALAALDEASTLFNRGGFEHYASVTGLQRAELLLAMGESREAYRQARELKEYFNTQRLVYNVVWASLVMVSAMIELLQSQGEERQSIEEAVSLCKEAARIAQQHALQEYAYRASYLLGRLAVEQGAWAEAAGYYEAAIDQLEHILQNLTHDLGPSFLHTTWGVYEDMIALCLRQGQEAEAFRYLERARSLVLRRYLANARGVRGLQTNNATILRLQQQLWGLQEEYRFYSSQLGMVDEVASSTLDSAFVRGELRRCEAKISELFERLQLDQGGSPDVGTEIDQEQPLQSVDVEQVCTHLAEDQLLLAYILSKGRVIIFALTRERLFTYEQPDGVARLEHLLPVLYAHLDPRGWGVNTAQSLATVRRLLNRLYDLLLAPIAHLLPASPGLLTIVPYGPLHKFPFHALYDGSHFLIEQFRVNYLPASSLLVHLGMDRGAQAVSKPSLVFGYSGHGHLQRAIDEAQAVTELLGGECFLEREATIAHLIEQVPGSPVIHIATHGKSRLDAPNFSYVRLADGQLNAIDAFQLDLRASELVTLSGCETGLALTGGGDEQLGLGRAFLAAGARSLVMSLWPVEDNATNTLMLRFYKNLLQGESKVQALREAQSACLSEASYAHPYFWAAFRLVGDTAPLAGKKLGLAS